MLGRVVNNYEIQALIGEGGQGTVYLALHPFMGRKAAIKVMRKSLVEDESMVARFLNEALAANNIGHPHIIDIIDAGRLPPADGEAAGLPYLMMEHLEGETLGARLRRVGKLTLADALPLLEQTCAALGAAHGKGIVHRDLKPENLYLTRDAGGERLKVLDFGIAKLLRPLGPLEVQTDGALFGTPTYMSPEQCRGTASEFDPRIDIYALGAIAFEMLAGRPPFTSTATGDLLVMHVSQPPPPLRDFSPEVPDGIAAAIDRALAKTPEARFSSMQDFWAALHWAAPWIPSVMPSGPAAPLPPKTLIQRVRRWPRAALALASAAVLLAATGLWLARKRPPASASSSSSPPAPTITPLPPRPSPPSPPPPKPPAAINIPKW
jgi:serine/threonine-protein kinase